MLLLSYIDFEGMLIHRSIIDEIGCPNESYFIVNDDTEYGIRASRFANVAYIQSAKLIRKRKNKIKAILSGVYDGVKGKKGRRQ